MKNLKISRMLYFSFGLTIVFTIILGIVGAVFTSVTNQKYSETVTPCAKALDYLTDTWLYYDDLKYHTMFGVSFIEYGVEEKFLNKTEECFSNIEEDMGNLIEISSELDFDEETLNALRLVEKDLNTLMGTQKELIEAIKNGNEKKAREISYNLAVGELTQELEENLDTVYYSINELNERQIETCTASSYICVGIIVFLLLTAFIVGTALSVYITKILKNEIYKIMSAAKEVSEGNLDVNLQSKYHNELGELTNSIGSIVEIFKFMLEDINNSAEEIEKGAINNKINEDKYKGDYKEVIVAINHTTGLLTNDLLTVVDTMSLYADGNFDSKIKRFNGEKAVINEKLDKVRENLIDITKDIDRLIDSVLKGRLDIRINSENYSGDWKVIAENFNKLMVAINEPVSEVSRILSKVSAADFSEEVKGNYQGEFNYMKQSVNKTIENNSSYINEISHVLTEMADNNLDIDITREYEGEYKSIKTAIEKIVFSFNRILMEISKSSTDIMTGSKHIASSSIELADGASSQAISVQNLTNTMNSILERVKNNSKVMKESNLFALSAKEKAFESKKKMDDMSCAIRDVSEASEKISSIIKVISDIAFQTNILAINAAVEAAHAGSLGRGFAVVAEEVRNLAARSQDAVQNTNDLITDVVKKVNIGSDIAVSAVSILDEVVNDVEEISGALLNSDASSQKELEAVESISSEINQINSITKKNSASSEEAAAASEELASQSEVFNKTLKNFKIKENFS